MAALGAAVACQTGSATQVDVTPITGVIVRAQSLLSLLGCGRGDDQVFKYAALVRYAASSVESGEGRVGFGVYDCFTDAYFQSLLPSPSGSLDFAVDIVAFNASSYGAQEDIVAAAPADPSTFDRLVPTWSTSCTATQQSNIQVLALCGPLAKNGAPGALTLPVLRFPGPDGGSYTCPADFASARVTLTGPGASEAVVEIGAIPSPPSPTDAGSDGGDGSTDAGAPDADGGDEAGLAVVPSVLPPVTGPTVQRDVPCGSQLVVRNRPAGEAYRYDVDLLGAGAPSVQLACSGRITPGVTVEASCTAASPP